MTPNVPRQPELDFNKLRKHLQDRIKALNGCYNLEGVAVVELQGVLDGLIIGKFDVQTSKTETA